MIRQIIILRYMHRNKSKIIKSLGICKDVFNIIKEYLVPKEIIYKGSNKEEKNYKKIRYLAVHDIYPNDPHIWSDIDDLIYFNDGTIYNDDGDRIIYVRLKKNELRLSDEPTRNHSNETYVSIDDEKMFESMSHRYKVKFYRTDIHQHDGETDYYHYHYYACFKASHMDLHVMNSLNYWFNSKEYFDAINGHRCVESSYDEIKLFIEEIKKNGKNRFYSIEV